MRRNTHKRLPDSGELFDATIEIPVTIRDPDKPIGTHVFTAMARTDRGLRWSAVTIDSGDVARGALDRISIPQEVLDHIAPTAMPRSSLIISDEPLHRETNYRTEFVIALNNQPQGGMMNRARSPDMRIGFGWGGWGGGPVLRSAAEQPELLLSAATAVVVSTPREHQRLLVRNAVGVQNRVSLPDSVRNGAPAIRIML